MFAKANIYYQIKMGMNLKSAIWHQEKSGTTTLCKQITDVIFYSVKDAQINIHFVKDK